MNFTFQDIFHFFGSTLLALLVGYVIIVLYFTFSQTRHVFFPDPILIQTPAAIGLPFEDITFKTIDGINLNGWFIPARNDSSVILFCHGNAGNISHRLESIQIFNNLGLSVFIFDYRGYGRSAGKPTEKGTYLDAEAAWLYLTEKKNIAQEQIIIFGRSLGSAIAAHLAVGKKNSGLILESSFSSAPDMAKEYYSFLPVHLIMHIKYNTLEKIKNIFCPLLVIHSCQDEIIPFRLGRSVFETANDPKQFLEIQGSHNNGFLISGEIYRKELQEFIDQMF